MEGRFLPKLLVLALVATLTAQATPLSDNPDASLIWEVFHPAWRPEAGYSELRAVANDPEHRLEPDFRIPPPLIDRVLFWATVYSQFTSRMRIVHDRDDPRLLYGYLDFNPLFRSKSPGRVELKLIPLENEVKTKLSMALSEAAGESSMSPLSPMDKALFRQFLAQREHGDPASVRPLIQNIRTQSGQSDIFQTALERSQNVLPSIEEVFQREGLPKALAKIPFVESSFNPSARSKIGAMGLWQFIPSTAKEFIHKDDRKKWADPLHQTRAAVKLLRGYRRALPDWGTAVTSYNSGIGRVSKLLRKHRLKGVNDLVALKEEDGGLGFAGRNFYAELLAANLVEAYKTELFSPRALAQEHQAISMTRELSFAPTGVCRLPKPASVVYGGRLPSSEDDSLAPAAIGNDTWVQQKLKDTSSWLGEAFRQVKGNVD